MCPHGAWVCILMHMYMWSDQMGNLACLSQQRSSDVSLCYVHSKSCLTVTVSGLSPCSIHSCSQWELLVPELPWVGGSVPSVRISGSHAQAKAACTAQAPGTPPCSTVLATGVPGSSSSPKGMLPSHREGTHHIACFRH